MRQRPAGDETDQNYGGCPTIFGGTMPLLYSNSTACLKHVRISIHPRRLGL